SLIRQRPPSHVLARPFLGSRQAPGLFRALAGRTLPPGSAGFFALGRRRGACVTGRGDVPGRDLWAPVGAAGPPGETPGFIRLSHPALASFGAFLPGFLAFLY